jgi:uncharacterized membrane protein YfcA
MEQWVKLVGVFGIVGVMFSVSYLFYDKNQIISIILFLVAIILAIYVVISEEEMKRKRHDAPWNFEEYKGE